MDVIAGADGAVDPQHPALLLSLLDHDHGVGAWRDRSAGHDPHRRAGADLGALLAAGDQLGQHAPLGQAVGGAQGVPVDSRLGHVRQRLLGADILGQHPALGGQAADLLGAERCHVLGDDP